MKCFTDLIVIMSFILCSCNAGALYDPNDSFVVDAIKKESNLTMSDVDRWKFLWLGSLASPLAAAGSIYSTYKLGDFGYKLADTIPSGGDQTYGKMLIENVFRGALTPSIVLNKGVDISEYEKWVGNKWVWAGVGISGAIFTSYKLLYPRIQAGIISKIKKLFILCKNTVIANQQYHDMNTLLSAMSDQDNTAWEVATYSARDNGVINLIDQCSIALLLIDQLREGGGIDEQEITSLRISIASFNQNLEKNRALLAHGLWLEEKKRATLQDERKNTLDMQAKEASLTGQHIKNVTGIWKVLESIVNFGMKHKTEFATAAGAVYGYRKLFVE